MNNDDGIDRYIGMYFSLQRKAEEATLSEKELDQLALCESVLQKRHELDEFDQWLDEAFGMKIAACSEACNSSKQQGMTPEPEKISRRQRKKLGSERYWKLLGDRIFVALSEEEKQWMAQFEKEFPRQASKLQKRILPDEEFDDEED